MPRFLTALLFLISFQLSAQKVNWKLTDFDRSDWIENRGQCGEAEEQLGESIQFHLYGSGMEVFATASGLHFRKLHFDYEQYNEEFEEIENRVKAMGGDREEREKLEHSLREEAWLRNKHYEWASYTWQGAATINATKPEKAVYHFNPRNAKQIVNCPTFHSISATLQSGIEIEIIAHKGGVKYNLYAPSAAALESWAMCWSEPVQKHTDGSLHIAALGTTLIDAAPTAQTDEGNPIPVRFSVDGSCVGVTAATAWPTGAILVDPWIVSIDSNTQSQGLSIVNDESNNTLIYVNLQFFSEDRIKKFDRNGNLVWSSVYAGIGSTDGDIEIEPVTNSVYASSIATTSKYDSNGIELWANSFYEAWSLEFNCSEGQFVGGGNFGPSGSKLHNLDPETGATLTTFLQPNDSTAAYDEIRAATSSPQGDYFFLSLTTIVKMCPALQVDYQFEHGHVELPYFGPLYHNISSGSPWGEYNAIAVDSQFVYTFDGDNVLKRTYATGTLVDSFDLNDGIELYNSGILVDSCGNVYVGGQTRVYVLDTNLNLADSSDVLSGVIYDLAFTDSGDVMASGMDFLAEIDFETCGKSACIPPDTFPYEFSADTVICFGDSVELFAQGGSEYFWFPDYNISATDTSHVLVKPDTSTTYGVVIKQDSCYFKIGYVRVFVDTITEYVLPPDTTICDESTIVLNVGGTAPQFHVYSTDGLFNDTGTTFTLAPDTTTTYQISSVGLDSSGCQADYVVAVLPRPPVNPDSALQCDAVAITLTLDTGANYAWSPTEFVTPDSSRIVSVLADSSLYLYINVYDHGICRWRDSIYLHVDDNPVLELNTYDTSVCFGIPFSALAEGADFYSWTPDTGLNVDTGANVIITPFDTITYYITGTDTFGCQTIAPMQVTVLPQALADFSINDTVVCLHEVVDFTIIGSGFFTITPGDELIALGDNSYRYIAENNLQINLGSAPPDQCPDTASVVITVPTFPEMTVSDTLMCADAPLVLELSDNVEMVWLPQSGVEYLGANRYEFSPNADQIYRMVNADGCADDDTLNIRVLDCNSFIPNVISPNADGRNDQFSITGEHIETAPGIVFNRWGQQVFSGDLHTVGWDGYVNGTVASAGVYYYEIVINDIFGKSRALRGEVTVVE